MNIRDNFLTIIFKKTGRILSFNITTSRFIIFLTLLFLLNTLLAFLIFQYGNLHYKKRILVKKVGSMEAEMEQMREEIKESRYYKRWADNIIYRRLYAGSMSGQGSSSSSGIYNDLMKLKPESTVIDNSLVGIDDFQVRSLNLELDFELSFNLVNKDRKHRRIGGYITIVGRNEEVIPPVYGVFPHIDFKDGAPIDYQEGLSFAIRYLRPVKVRINQPSIGSKFNKVIIMVYSTGGELMLKQGFNIEKMLQMDFCS